MDPKQLARMDKRHRELVELSDALEKYVNDMTFDATELPPYLLQGHRTLVASQLRLVFATLVLAGRMYEAGNYDARDEWEKETAGKIVSAFPDLKALFRFDDGIMGTAPTVEDRMYREVDTDGTSITAERLNRLSPQERLDLAYYYDLPGGCEIQVLTRDENDDSRAVEVRAEARLLPDRVVIGHDINTGEVEDITWLVDDDTYLDEAGLEKLTREWLDGKYTFVEPILGEHYSASGAQYQHEDTGYDHDENGFRITGYRVVQWDDEDEDDPYEFHR